MISACLLVWSVFLSFYFLFFFFKVMMGTSWAGNSENVLAVSMADGLYYVMNGLRGLSHK